MNSFLDVGGGISPTLLFLLDFGDQTDTEVNGLISQAVLLHQLGTAAVGADTILTVVQAQDGAAALFQFEVVTLFGQFFLGKVGGVEAEALGADNRHLQIVAFQNSIVTIAVRAILLGTDIVFMKTGNSVLKQAMPCGAALIRVVFDGAQTVIGNILQPLRQEHSQAETRQLGEFGVALCQAVHGNGTGYADSPVQFDGDELLDRRGSDGNIGMDTNLVFGCHKMSVVCTGNHVVIVGSHPVQLQLPVIVSRCSPDVEVHGLVQDFLTVNGHLGEHTGKLIVLVVKCRGADGDIAIALGGGNALLTLGLILPDLQGCLVTAICILQLDFVKAQIKALRQNLGGVLQLVGNLQVAASFFRNFNVQRQGAVAVRSNCGELFNLAAGYNLTIAVDFIGSGSIVRQGNKVHIVMDGQLTGLGIVMLDTGRTMNVLILHQTGAGSSVREHQAIDAEVAVMGPFAAVTAVQILSLAILGDTGVDSVVAPLPNEAAAHNVVFLDELPVIFQIAGAVTHGVRILAHQEGLVRVGIQIALQAFHRGIHITVQINVGEIILTLAAAVLGAFIVGQSGRIEVLGPGQSCFKAAAIGAFIAHGPADNRGTVLISLDTQLGTVHGCFHKVGVICKGFVPGLNMILPDIIFFAVQSGSAVAFVVSLIDDHEAALITQLVEHGCIGIVAGTNCIEIVFLNHPQVTLHMLDADDGAGNRIGVMAVDAAELNGAAVQEHDVVLNVDRTEAHTVGNDFIGSFQQQSVQVRLLRIPEGRILDGEDCLVGISAAVEGLHCAGANSLFCCIQQLDLGRNELTVISKANADGGFFLIHQSGGEVITDAVFRTLQDIYIAEDAGGAELILVFQVAAVTPLQNHNSQGVLAFPDGFGNIKLGGRMRYLAVTQECTIQPDIEAGVNALKVQICLGCIFISFIDKIIEISTAGILIRNIRGVSGERIADVGVLMLVVTVVLPDAGNRDGIPGGSIIVFFVELIFEVMDAFTVLEFPVVIQQLEAVRVLPVFNQVVHSYRSRNEVASVGRCAYMMCMQVFVVSRNNHNFLLRYFVFLRVDALFLLLTVF